MSSEFASIILNALLNNHDVDLSGDLKKFIENLSDAVILDILKNSSDVKGYEDLFIHLHVIYILYNLGVPYKLKGFKYICTAVLKSLEISENGTVQITKQIYPYIARKYNTLGSSVERNIRYITDKFTEETDADTLKRFGISSSNHSNSQFISDITKYIRKNRLII